MCTVTYCDFKHELIFTSNRDEHFDRPLASEIQVKKQNGVTLWFPQDPVSKGSWFCVTSKAEVLILLNGAFEKHTPDPPYRVSRGSILLEIASAIDVSEVWKSISLHRVEPFTIVAYTNKQIQEFIWDGSRKYQNRILNKPWNMWSSVTLYPTEVRTMREKWFANFISSGNKVLTPGELLHFHTQTENRDSQNGLLINRNNQTLTKNITQCRIQESFFELSHYDLISQTCTSLKESFL